MFNEQQFEASVKSRLTEEQIKQIEIDGEMPLVELTAAEMEWVRGGKKSCSEIGSKVGCFLAGGCSMINGRCSGLRNGQQ